MRRPSLSTRSIQAISESLRVQPRPSSLCLACRLQRTNPPPRVPFSNSAIRDETIPLRERIRRKLWNTELPPGQDNPYVKLDPAEKEKQVQQRAEEEEKRSAQPEVSDGGYVPAMTWDGLESVGDVEEGVGGPTHRFQAFMTSTPITIPQELTLALHRAVVEVYTLKEAGRHLSDLSRAPTTQERLTGDVQVTPSANLEEGEVTLTYPGDGARDVILSSIYNESVDSGPEDGSRSNEASSSAELQGGDHSEPEEASMNDATIDESAKTADLSPTEELIFSWDPSWLSISLKDPKIKFAILKRVMQLTGHRIPDPVMARIHDIQALHDHLITPPKPKKLAQALLQDVQLTSLPNVKIYDRRVTPIDKERVVGRWKVIEKELQNRGLPVTGHVRNGESFMIGA